MGGGSDGTNILPDLDIDCEAAVPHYARSDLQHTPSTDHRHTVWSKIDAFFKKYMRRPHCLENLTASQFRVHYVVKLLISSPADFDSDMLLIDSPASEAHLFDVSPLKRFLVQQRVVIHKRPKISAILNVTNRGPADDQYPRFSAAARNVCFISNSGRSSSRKNFNGQVGRIVAAPPGTSKGSKYVNRCHELANGLLARSGSSNISGTAFNSLRHKHHSDNDTHNDSDSDSEACEPEEMISWKIRLWGCPFSSIQIARWIHSQWRRNGKMQVGYLLLQSYRLLRTETMLQSAKQLDYRRQIRD